MIAGETVKKVSLDLNKMVWSHIYK